MSKVKVTGNENVKIVFCSYLYQQWIDLRQTKNKMTTGPLYTCVRIHFTGVNTTCSWYLSVIIHYGRLAVYLFVSLWRALLSITFLMKKNKQCCFLWLQWM